MAFLNGQAIPEPDLHGERILDSDFLLLFNAHSDPVDFVLPPAQYGVTWQVRLDTTMAEPSSVRSQDWLAATAYPVAGRSIVVLESVLPPKKTAVAKKTTSATLSPQPTRPEALAPKP
jgi:glycogen operon protein